MGLRATQKLFNESWDGNEPDPLRYVRKHRKLNCEQYDLCLEVAVLLGWPSFSCRLCNGEGPDEILLMTAHEMAEKWIEGKTDPFAYPPQRVLYREYFIPL